MNWQAWSETQAGQILELRQRVKVLRNRLTYSERRAKLWRARALRKEAKTR
jgi:hypothetical protein